MTFLIPHIDLLKTFLLFLMDVSSQRSNTLIVGASHLLPFKTCVFAIDVAIETVDGPPFDLRFALLLDSFVPPWAQVRDETGPRDEHYEILLVAVIPGVVCL